MLKKLTLLLLNQERTERLSFLRNTFYKFKDHLELKSFHWTHFMMPFFAHALGTLSGAYAAARLAASRPLVKALGIAVVFLFGGIQMVQLLPSPMWFNVIDLGLAYIPMGYLGYLLAKRSEVHQTIPE